MADFQPDVNDTYISIPITFDYKGGRAQDTKGKIVMTLILAVVLILANIFVLYGLRESFELWQRLGLVLVIFYIVLFILRFFVFHELRFSDMYEELKRIDYQPETSVFWKIFDIDYKFPYICYFQNGYKGVFVRMEKGAISGKPDTAVFDHYELISNAYNTAHASNMNIVSTDYMDSVGNDPRLVELMSGLVTYTNPDMVNLLIDIYSNLQREASANYSNYDVYLFLSRGRVNDFIHDVKRVVGQMIGGNFITYTFLDRNKIREFCLALWNLHDLSVNACCETVLTETQHTGIVPISVRHSDGSIEVLGKTMEEKKRIREEIARKEEDRKREEEIKKRKLKEERKRKKSGVVEIKEEQKPDDNEDLDLF